MKETKYITLRAQESSQPLKKCTHDASSFNRGFYKPMGISGDTLREALALTRNIWKYCR
jgi:hypothetical protein